jgi:hypothetical protein
MTDDERATLDAEIAQAWPKLWEKANIGTKTSKRRKKLRQRWLGERAHEAFANANPEAKCGNCLHFGTMPPGLKGNCCNLDCDYYGYTVAKPDGLCTRWEGMRIGLRP